MFCIETCPLSDSLFSIQGSAKRKSRKKTQYTIVPDSVKRSIREYVIAKCKEEGATGFPKRITDLAATAHGVDKEYVFNHMKNYKNFFKPAEPAEQEEPVPPVE